MSITALCGWWSHTEALRSFSQAALILCVHTTADRWTCKCVLYLWKAGVQSDAQLAPLQKARHCSLMMTVPSGVKNQRGIFKWPIKTLQPPLKNYLFLDECFQTPLWQTNCSLRNPTKPFKSLHSALLGGNASVVNYVFSFRNKTLFSPNPLTESIESGSQTTIRRGLSFVWRQKILGKSSIHQST